MKRKKKNKDVLMFADENAENFAINLIHRANVLKGKVLDDKSFIKAKTDFLVKRIDKDIAAVQDAVMHFPEIAEHLQTGDGDKMIGSVAETLQECVCDMRRVELELEHKVEVEELPPDPFYQYVFADMRKDFTPYLIQAMKSFPMDLASNYMLVSIGFLILMGAQYFVLMIAGAGVNIFRIMFYPFWEGIPFFLAISILMILLQGKENIKMLYLPHGVPYDINLEMCRWNARRYEIKKMREWETNFADYAELRIMQERMERKPDTVSAYVFCGILVIGASTVLVPLLQDHFRIVMPILTLCYYFGMCIFWTLKSGCGYWQDNIICAAADAISLLTR